MIDLDLYSFFGINILKPFFLKYIYLYADKWLGGGYWKLTRAYEVHWLNQNQKETFLGFIQMKDDQKVCTRLQAFCWVHEKKEHVLPS